MSFAPFLKSSDSGILWTVEESSNLLAFSPNAAIPIGSQTVPSRSSGSFPAIPIPKNVSPAPSSQPKPATKNSGVPARFSVELSGGIIIMFIVAASAVFLSRSRAVKTIRSWKTGLSGQLQKAFISGVPKVKRGELEVASEDFSNIIISDDEGVYTIYKGTLSSGVEIAVASTDLTSTKQWSRRSESVFRKKIDTLSRMNHKNFLNLVGYCEEDEPFTRMMVFEYAPNGTLHEHLHGKSNACFVSRL
ncbi:hypothetical protein M569_16400 [Genlisea aurea]|uniref:Serine-threonine/tyrosine-protein kinase catalytic domain-containing protein n=1 Tax=Genlisea aurea TaxID=192259 RepID=S8BVP2_9LAMI|nr:hypothetical protein M569_16400 [Genlisea aurea]